MKAIEDYIAAIDPNRRPAFEKLLKVIEANLPEGFELDFQYGMPAFVVPLTRYPKGYHCATEKPLPFLSLGVQKGHIGIYHMGIYADKALTSWFESAYAEAVPTKLNMGKSCIRITNVKTIPYDLIAQLSQKMSVDNWIDIYETTYKH